MTDQQLIDRAHAGDRRAADLLAERFIGLARWIAKDYFYPGAEQDDVVQYALLGLAGGIHTWDPSRGTPVKEFLCRCMRNRILEGLISSTRKKHGFLNDARSLDAPLGVEAWSEDSHERLDLLATGEDPCDTVIAWESFRERLEVIRQMTPLERCSLVGLHVQGLSYQELAQELGRSEKSVDNALVRAKRRLAEAA